jgi:hypothetical protein
MDTLDVENAEHTPFRGTYEFLASPSVPSDIHIADPVLQPLLTRFDSIFQEPTDLPPSRPDDHRITLTPDAKLLPWTSWVLSRIHSVNYLTKDSSSTPPRHTAPTLFFVEVN